MKARGMRVQRVSGDGEGSPVGGEPSRAKNQQWTYDPEEGQDQRREKWNADWRAHAYRFFQFINIPAL